MPKTDRATNNPDMGHIAIQTPDSKVTDHLTSPQPAFDWLMLITQETPDFSPGGINMQAIEKIPVPYGRILKKGPDCSDTFKVGQHILYPLYAGNDLPLQKDGATVNVKFIHEEDVICTFDLVKPLAKRKPKRNRRIRK